MFPLQFLYNFFYIAVVTDFEEKKKKAVQYDISLYKEEICLEVPRTLFTHFGIYLGNKPRGSSHSWYPAKPWPPMRRPLRKTVTNNRLILGVIAKKASVRVDSLEDFAYEGEILVNPMDKVCSRSPFEGEEVARRAEKLFGSVVYSLLWYNCEHYVMYCRYGTQHELSDLPGEIFQQIKSLIIYIQNKSANKQQRNKWIKEVIKKIFLK